MKKYIAILAALLVSFSCLSACSLDFDENDTNVENIETTEKISNNKIEMPYDSEDYKHWTLEETTEQLKNLGFTNIKTYPCEPDDNRYEENIFDIQIDSGLFSSDPWNAGESYYPDSEISIYYNEAPLLNVDNCPDLVTILTSQDMDYLTFAEKYDGKYVEFDAYVTTITKYEHIIQVTGGKYDGKTELGHYDQEYYKGLIIQIGDRSWDCYINPDLEEGDNVTVSGRIDADYSHYFDQLYIETRYIDWLSE